MDVVDLWAQPVEEKKPEGMFVIKAFFNKSTGRQMYLSAFDDSLEGAISAVPYATTYERCEKIIRKANRTIEKDRAEKNIRSRFPKEINFEIIPVEEDN